MGFVSARPQRPPTFEEWVATSSTPPPPPGIDAATWEEMQRELFATSRTPARAPAPPPGWGPSLGPPAPPPGVDAATWAEMIACRCTEEELRQIK